MDLDRVAREVVAKSNLTAVKLEETELAVTLSGQVAVSGRTVRLEVIVDESISSAVPEVRLLERGRYGHLAHVNASGTVCIGPQEAMVPDFERPVEVVLAALAGAQRELERAFAVADVDAIIDEFEAYWRDQPGAIRIEGYVAPTGAPRRLWVQKRGKNDHTPQVVADSLEAYTAYHPRQPWCGDAHHRALFIPLARGAKILPPAPGERWIEADLRQYLPFVAPEHANRVDALLAEHWAGDELVLFSLPRTTHGFVLFGAWLDGVTGKHPLLEGGRATRMVPFVVDRRDAAFLRPRGGASNELGHRRVLLVGCGSVGGFLAAELARAGVGHITLVDKELLKPENIFRHELGMLGVDRQNSRGDVFGKAATVGNSLRARYPYLSVKAYDCTVQQLITTEPTVLADHDVIVLATGNTGAELSLARTLFKEKADVDLIHTWLDPFGVGAHALLSRPGTRGCLRCLFTDPSTRDFTTNRATFVDPLADVDLDLAGCGTRFTPYASLAASRCALLAAQMVLDTVTGLIAAPAMWSEKGRKGPLIEAGATTTPRYDLPDHKLRSQAFAIAGCPLCAP